MQIEVLPVSAARRQIATALAAALGAVAVILPATAQAAVVAPQVVTPQVVTPQVSGAPKSPPPAASPSPSPKPSNPAPSPSPAPVPSPSPSPKPPPAPSKPLTDSQRQRGWDMDLAEQRKGKQIEDQREAERMAEEERDLGRPAAEEASLRRHEVIAQEAKSYREGLWAKDKLEEDLKRIGDLGGRGLFEKINDAVNVIAEEQQRTAEKAQAQLPSDLAKLEELGAGGLVGRITHAVDGIQEERQQQAAQAKWESEAPRREELAGRRLLAKITRAVERVEDQMVRVFPDADGGVAREEARKADIYSDHYFPSPAEAAMAESLETVDWITSAFGGKRKLAELVLAKE